MFFSKYIINPYFKGNLQTIKLPIIMCYVNLLCIEYTPKIMQESKSAVIKSRQAACNSSTQLLQTIL